MNARSDSRPAEPPTGAQRPVLVFDDECASCRRWASRWQRIAGPRLECVPARDAAGRIPGLSPSELAKAVHLVEPGGRISKGAEAVVRALARAGRGRFPLWLYRKVPGMSAGMEFFYRLVARRRTVA